MPTERPSPTELSVRLGALENAMGRVVEPSNALYEHPVQNSRQDFGGFSGYGGSSGLLGLRFQGKRV